eukprot:CAMPEP_0113828262 /NCGR_PEP_ID=MMETSP0328-20130328/5188_1 /TAXON_ID=39455 /ORGANISM="Alexandrium minutum" /LENGTH=232 /DNA_ID=CAMNT_0000796269 /DNA_START=54 /DNA_END=749 /DNA_ORIENTATION=- /assembly_acc=CAM_ASM_000350
MRDVQVRHGQFRMVVHAGRDIVSNELALGGVWEISSPQDMLRPLGDGYLLPQDGVFLDIGGNLGYYSFLFAREGYKVITVEPMTKNRKAIEGSLCLNPELRERITLVAAALVSPEEVGHRHCVIRSTNYQINAGNGQLKCGSAAEVMPCDATDSNCEDVPVRTLDNLLEELKLPRIDVAKMDIELYECSALRGGLSLFRQYRPKYMQVETQFADAGLCVENVAKEFKYRTVV